MSMLSKVIYRLNAVPTKILMSLLTEMEKAILKFVWNPKYSI
jgi:hypothetical protein